MGTKLTSDDVARLRMKAKRGTLTPEEQVLWAEHVGEQSPAPPPPSTKKSKRGVDVHKISELVPKLFGALLLVVALVTFGPPLARVGIDIVGDMFHAGNPQADGAITVSSQVDHYNRSVSDLGNGGGYGGADVYVCGDKMVWVDFNSESTTLDNPDLDSSLLVGGRYDGNGFYLRKDNYLEKMPLFAMSRYITYNREWTERARIMKSGDGADRFNADVASGKLDQWLRKCLLFTCVEMQNHMRTFTGSDGRFYRNELCMDTTNGETLASEDLKQLVCGEDEKRIIDQWNVLLDEAKKTAEYDSSLTYGVYQIFAEIDTSYKDDEGKTVWNNLEVHSALQTLKTLVKEYYNKEIVPTLFEYEFLK